MTEDAWCAFTLDEEAIRTGFVVAGAFSVGPVYWEGGARHGLVAHRAPTPGLRSAALRLLSSTAVVRPLTIVADSIMFSTDHITLRTPEKEYDILLEGDPVCPYHVHLGSAFPERPLAATVHLLNHSAVPYSYYWSVRPWDKILLSAEKQHSEVFSEVIESELTSLHTESVSAIRVEPVRGAAGARSSLAVHVCAPRAGADCGLHRLVLMLILTDIPRESLGPEYDDIILSTKTVEEEEIPGLCEAWSREVCEVLVTQLEVWWEVVPMRYVLHPPVLHLTHTRRVSSVELQVEVTQLHAGGAARAEWRGDVQTLPPLAPLQAGRSVRHRLKVPLAAAHHEAITNIFQLEASEGEWRAWCVVRSRCALPRPALLPACRRLGAAPPAAPLAAALTVCNNTQSMITWRVNIYPWWCPRGGARCLVGEQEVVGAAGGAGELCAVCASSCCACGALAPAAGDLPHAQSETVTYRCRAPAVEGSVLNIAQLRAGQAGSGRGEPARSALLAHRALRPRLVLRALRCGCSHPCQCRYNCCLLQ
ncbi:PREDICTED: uncharacterized protein LOC106126966 [Papilio xuthus]|uniref:Uncharacterized protein LOC106126966 n=1 Tax=Papilio xuthus TaxID=66420 RepID=A0AAJ6ZW24_PAPXU|nr:PREDICTED: uncharacterized protein LOC106126966 [Papilio xuthus]